MKCLSSLTAKQYQYHRASLYFAKRYIAVLSKWEDFIKNGSCSICHPLTKKKVFLNQKYYLFITFLLVKSPLIFQFQYFLQTRQMNRPMWVSFVIIPISMTFKVLWPLVQPINFQEILSSCIVGKGKWSDHTPFLSFKLQIIIIRWAHFSCFV